MEENEFGKKNTPYNIQCEEDIKYIQENILPDFKFDFSNISDEYYHQLHELLSTFVYAYLSRELEDTLMTYIDCNVQQPEKTINYIAEHCELKTLLADEQFAVFQLLSESDVRTLLELALEDCDTNTYGELYSLIRDDNYESFRTNICNVKYSASKVSKIAQAFCIHDCEITNRLYSKIINDLFQRIKSYNEDFTSNNIQRKIEDIYYFPHIVFMLNKVLGLNYEPVTTFIEEKILEYGFVKGIESLRKPIPSSLEELLPRIVCVRQMMLEQYIHDNANISNENANVETPLSASSSGKEVLSLTEKPTKIITKIDENAFCKEFASYCTPNKPDVIRSFFWSDGSVVQPPITWRSNKLRFVAFLHYAYKGRNLPRGTENLVRKVFMCHDKPMDIKGYSSTKYKKYYDEVEKAINKYKES